MGSWLGRPLISPQTIHQSLMVTLKLNIPQALITEQRDIKLELRGKPSCWLDFRGPEGAMQFDGGEESPGVLLSCGPLHTMS